MRKPVLCFLLLLFVAVSCSGQTADWKAYKNERGNFTVLFPGDPQDTTNSSVPGLESHNLFVRSQGMIYLVIYSVSEAPQPVNEATYGDFKKGVFSQLPKCEILAEQAVSPAIKNYVGHSYRMSCTTEKGNISIAGNLYWGKHYAYAMMALFAADSATPPDVKKFIDSFAVIDPAK